LQLHELLDAVGSPIDGTISDENHAFVGNQLAHVADDATLVLRADRGKAFT